MTTGVEEAGITVAVCSTYMAVGVFVAVSRDEMNSG